jgi:hypothetical protein
MKVKLPNVELIRSYDVEAVDWLALLNEAFIFLMGSNPKPNKIIPVLDGQRPPEGFTRTGPSLPTFLTCTDG